MKQRRSPRIAVSGSVAFSGEDITGHGRVSELSVSGCVLETEVDRPFPTNAYLSLRLDVPDHHQPLDIDLAAVRWAQGSRAGLEFIRLDPGTQTRLRSLTFSTTMRTVTGEWTRVPM